MIDIPGAAALLDWFGRWPSFHNAEMLSLGLHRSAPSKLRLCTFEVTGQLHPDGSYLLFKPLVVVFTLEGVSHLDLNGFSPQNVIAGLTLEQLPSGCYRLTLENCYGLSGSLLANHVSVHIEPGGAPP